MKHEPSTSHERAVVKRLREDREFAAEYLKVAIEDTEEPKVLLLALRRLTEANGGIAKVAKTSGMDRATLERGLSPNNSPRLSIVRAVMKAADLHLALEDAPVEIKPIKSERDYRRVLKEIGTLMDAKKDTPQGKRLDALATLATTWEETHHSLESSRKRNVRGRT